MRGDSDALVALEMDRRSWLWRRKSSEKSPGETESSGSISSHSERFSDDQVGSILGFEFLAHCFPLNLFVNWIKREQQMGVISGYWNGFSQFRIFVLCRICHVLSFLRLVSNYVLLLIFLSSQKILKRNFPNESCCSYPRIVSSRTSRQNPSYFVLSC